MHKELNEIVNCLLDMNPDPIPKFVLLKEFKGLSKSSAEYNDLYDKVCTHKFITKWETSQNEQGFWQPFHGLTEGVIRMLLSYGLEKDNPILMKVRECLVNLLQGKITTGQHEKQDNPLWYPVMFEPLIFASMLSLLEPENEHINEQRQLRSKFAQTAFANGKYDAEADASAQLEHFGFKIKRTIPPFSYYNLLLLAPNGANNYISDEVSQALVDFHMNEASGVYYVYGNKPSKMVSISEQNRDSSDFWHWIRALSLIAQFKGWEKYEHNFIDWIMQQRNQDGLWEFPKKFDFALSNSWRGKNKMIDSTIFVLRFLGGKQAF
jgi:hypothetical protein